MWFFLSVIVWMGACGLVLLSIERFDRWGKTGILRGIREQGLSKEQAEKERQSDAITGTIGLIIVILIPCIWMM